ncbi:MAG TPA: hypothetical protein VMU22_02115 [Rhizomicrobium sp.]|nr:hypothetical protein [Rhizomicrobium sp.]
MLGRPGRTAALLLVGAAFAATAYAADPHGSSGFHGTVGGHGGAPSGGFHGSAAVHGGMPPHGFHGTPPSFHGAYPHGGASPSLGLHHAGPGHFGTFHGHDFAHFTPGERAAWQGGSWRHEWHNGHYGWWWFVGGLWFFYTAPIYPYPLYVGPDYYYDYYGENGAPPYYWYYCEDPAGYYPYVQQCNGPWEPVPPSSP